MNGRLYLIHHIRQISSHQQIFHLLLSLNNHMRNKQFNNKSDLKEEVSRLFRVNTNNFCKNGIYKLLNRLGKVIKCKSSYFDEQMHFK